MLKYIIPFIILISTIGYSADFPYGLPDLRETYRIGDVIDYQNANAIAKTLNSVCEKIGIDNSQNYSTRYTNTFDYKIYDLYSITSSNRVLISNLGSGGTTNLSASNVFEWIYLIPTNENTRSGGLRMFYNESQYESNNLLGFQMFTQIEDEYLYTTSIVTAVEFKDRMKFYGYYQDESTNQNQNTENLILALYAGLRTGVASNQSTSVNWLLETGGIYMARPLIIDNAYFAETNNSYFSIQERSTYYNPLAVHWNTTNDILDIYTALDPTNKYGSFLVFKPVPKGLYNILPTGYEFLDADETPVFTIRGLYRPYGTTNYNQFWSIDHHNKKTTGIPDPQRGEIEDAVNLGFLNKEFDRRLAQIHVNVLDINVDKEKTAGTYVKHYDKHYYSTMERVYANPVINTTTNLPIYNLPLHSYSIQNVIDYILLSYDDGATNYYSIVSTNAAYVATNIILNVTNIYTIAETYNTTNLPIDMTFTGCITDPYNTIANLYGTAARNEYTGIAMLTAGSNYVDVIIDSSQGNYTNILSSIDDTIVVSPYRHPDYLMYYWANYISNDMFRIYVDAPIDSDIEFKWMIPKVLNNSFNSVYYPKDDIVLPTGYSQFAKVNAGEIMSTNINISVDGDYGDWSVIFTPQNATTDTNIFSWYQTRDASTTNSTYVRLMLDCPPTNDIYFSWVKVRNNVISNNN